MNEYEIVTQIKTIHRQRLQLEQFGGVDSPKYQELFDFEETLLNRLVESAAPPMMAA